MTKLVKFVTEEEHTHILSCVRENTPEAFPQVFELLLRSLWATGCRPAEMIGRKGREGRNATDSKPRISNVKDHHGLRPRDILPNHRLYIEGKNTGGDDTSKLKPRMVLCTDPETYQDLQKLAQARSDDSANLFAPDSSNGISWVRRYVEKLQGKLVGRLADFSLSWYRHSHAIHAIRNGVDLVSIQRQLGHENLRTTTTYLRHASIDEKPYLRAFGVKASTKRSSCPACGFEWEEHVDTGEMTWEARMGLAMRR